MTDCHFDKKGTAVYIGISSRQLDYYLSGPTPPPGFRLGKKWIFRKSELDRWLEQFRAGANIDRIVNETVREVLGG